MVMNSSVTRPLAVVTGASNGIGYELAKQFAQNGFDLLVTATGSSIDEAAIAFEKLGAKVETVQADLASYDGVETLYNQIKATGRPVDAIAINAGVGVGGDFARETDLKDELNLIDLNVVSSVHLAKRVVKDMVELGKGSNPFHVVDCRFDARPVRDSLRRLQSFCAFLFRRVTQRIEGHGRYRHRPDAGAHRYQLLPPRGYGRHKSGHGSKGRSS
ncbi:hypothetical protein NSTCB13_01518 [Nostoc sp. DSM 114160]|jgi:NAD(P)-dependent dehydrogenase (short-subunit alcohol dehydrogenase family)